MKAIAMAIVLLMGFTAAGQTGKVVHLADYLTPGTKDATPALRKAVAHCRAIRAARLVIPKGVYECWPDLAEEKYLFISNNDEGLKRIIFLIEDMEDFEIDGQGAKLVFHGFVAPFLISRSKNIRLHHLSIDWSRTFHSEGKILSTGKDSMDLSISPAFPYRITNDLLVFHDERNTVYPYGGLLEFDPQKRETAFMADDYWTNADVRAAAIAPGHVRIYRKGIKGTKGNIMVFGAGGRQSPAITITDSKDIKVDSMTIFHCGGMGVIAQRSGNITLQHLQVTPAKGRMISATADATHFANCYGAISIRDCLFENQLDDAANIHGIYVQVTKRLSPAEILVALKHPQQMGFDFIRPGMMMELVHSNSLMRYGTAEVQQVERLNKTYTRLRFSAPLPAELTEKDVIAGMGDTPTVDISHCIMRGNRARGILLGSRGRIRVMNNVFHNAGAAILFEGDAEHWFERSGVKNVTIAGNVFDNCNYGVWGNAVIQVGSGIDRQSRKTSRYNNNILIEKNIFKMFSPRLINAYSVDGLVFRDNIIEHTKDYPDQFPHAKAFEIADCDRVVIKSR